MSTEQDKQTENIAQTAERLANDAEPVRSVTGDDSVVAIPPDWTVHDLEKYLDRPRRIEVIRPLATLEGFADYVTAHAIKNRTAVYVGLAQATAVIDGMDVKEKVPAWGDHQAILTLSQTPEWTAWSAASGQSWPQRAFIDFIQDRAGEIAEPPLADLVQQLQAINAESTGSRRDSASHLSTEAARQMATKITNQLPEYLDLRMPVLKCEPDQLTDARARLSVKLNDDGVTFAATLVNADILLDTRIREFVARLKKKLGDKAPVYF